MTFTDAIKKSVLEGFDAGNLTTSHIIVVLGAAVALGLFIYAVYRTTTKSGFYNRSFNKSLAVMPVITAGIMLAMQSNLVISLGMVGALSIVRFRNAVKDSSDLAYLFWSISMGIICGAGLFEIAIILSIFVTILVVVLDLLPTLKAPCILVVSGDTEADEKSVMESIRKYAAKAKIRSRNITKNGTEWIVEMQAKEEAEMVNAVAAVEGVVSVNLMTHDGEVRF
ncbi:MAG: DUF4956 domain-containing protein [Oscillospiraceae bacterium]|nr:DUF4956 domain-containing protein [Oscillospiraceae bacterium]